MTTLVLTLVGDDRAGIVAAVAAAVDAAGGNWENSRLAELSGAFAGIVEVSADAARVDALRAALEGIEGFVTVAVPAPATAAPRDERRVEIDVLGNDHTGIVRDISSALSAQGLSIERMSTETRDAAMSGGRLFAAHIVASVPVSVRLDDVRARLEELAAEIQVDLSVS